MTPEPPPIDPAESRFAHPASAADVAAIVAAAFNGRDRALRASEVGLGDYNSIYRLDLASGRRVILRIAPPEPSQFRSEAQLMRNEYATVPFLTPVRELTAQVLAADWTRTVIDRDWMIAEWLDGVPTPEVWPDLDRAQRASVFRQIGAITARVHAIEGPAFGPVQGPHVGRWSDALVDSLALIAADLDAVDAPADGVRAAAEAVARHRDLFDEVTAPRLLAGDLWTVNTLLDVGASPDGGAATEAGAVLDAESFPRVSGIVDLDRTMWGDPLADWGIYMATRRPGTERDEFFASDGYGPLADDAASRRRQLIYTARHFGAGRLEMVRLGHTDGLAQSVEAFDDLLRRFSA